MELFTVLLRTSQWDSGRVALSYEATSRMRPMHCNAQPLVHTMLYLLTSYVLDLCAALVTIYLGSRFSALLARFGTAANANTLAHGLAKIRAAREYDDVSLFAFTLGVG